MTVFIGKVNALIFTPVWIFQKPKFLKKLIGFFFFFFFLLCHKNTSVTYMKCDQALLWTHHRQTKSPAAAALNSVPALQHSLHSWSLLAVPGPCPPPLQTIEARVSGQTPGPSLEGAPDPLMLQTFMFVSQPSDHLKLPHNRTQIQILSRRSLSALSVSHTSVPEYHP